MRSREFHRHSRTMALATAKARCDLLAAAVVAGELVPDTDTGSLSGTVQAILGGSLLSWALYREGTATGLGARGARGRATALFVRGRWNGEAPAIRGRRNGAGAFGKAQNAQLE